MPFIKAKNGNVIEVAEDLVEEFLAQGHALVGGTKPTAAEPPEGAPAVAAEQGPSPADDVERPSRGASLAAWAAYADATGVTYPEGAGRDEVRDLVEAADQKQD